MAEKPKSEKKPTAPTTPPPAGTAGTTTPAVLDSERSLFFTQVEPARGAWKRAQAAGYNTVGGTSVLTTVGEGFGLALNIVTVDARPMDEGGDLYKISGGGNRYGLGKAALFRLAGVAGLNWDAQQSQRLDDGAVEAYCQWRAVGSMRDPFSGNVRTIMAEKAIDMRPGSAEYNKWRRQAERKAHEWNKPEQAEGIFQKRLEEFLPHLASQCETKAQLRCIRSALGLLTAYTMATLQKPFVVPVLVLAPESVSDPDLRNRLIEARFLGAMHIGQQLYGSMPQRTPVTAASPVGRYVAPVPRQPAPPVQVDAAPDEDDMDEGGGDSEPEPEPPAS
jgi:hypothetical protein